MESNMQHGESGSDPRPRFRNEDDQLHARGLLASESQGLLNDKVDKAKAQRVVLNFIVYAICISISHGALVTTLSYAKTELGNDWGSVLLEMVYFSIAFSSLFLSQYLTTWLTCKHATMLSTLAIAIFQLCFWLALETEASKPYLVPLGSFVGGIGWGLAFTASGVYYKFTCEEYSNALDASEINAENTLAGMFSAIFTLLESAFNLGAACFIELTSSGEGGKGVFLFYALLCFVSVFVVSFVHSFADKEAERISGVFFTEIFETLKFGTTNFKMILISPHQMLYGFTLAFFFYYVDGTLTPDSFSNLDIGLFGALEALVSAVVSPLYAWAANRVGRIWVMLWCHACFLVVYACFLGLSSSSLSTIGVVLLLYIFQGAGMAVFQSINRAMIVTYFPSSSETAAAFANSLFLVGAIAGLGVVSFDNLQSETAAVIGLVILVASAIGQVTASTVHFYHEPNPLK